MSVAAPDYRLRRPPTPPIAAPTLDAEQRRVVQHRGGPLLVLAGPGTGKTTTLVEAAVARVDAGVPLEHILMLTFSRRAAGELRDRVTARLARTVREPLARTMHSYAFGVLRMAAVADRRPAPRLLAGAEQDVIVRELLAGATERWPAALRPALSTRAFAGELRDLLMRAVERGLDGPGLAALGRRAGRSDWVVAGEFLAEYQNVTALKDPGGYDPAELIRTAVSTLRDDPALLASERATRRRIFVDEYQDTDPAQAELLALLADGADELILVGDPDQSIYAFRGADEAALREVPERFGAVSGTVPVVALTQSRRSGPVLLAATRRVAHRLPGRGAHRGLLAGDGQPPGEVEVAVFRTPSEEATHLAAVLRRAHLDGLPWSRMAVLVRSTTGQLAPLRRALSTAGVPVTVRGEDLPLAQEPVVAMLLEVLRCVLHPQDLTEETAQRLLLGPVGGADAVYLRRLHRALRQLARATGEPVSLAAVLRDGPGLAVLPASVRRPVRRVAQVLDAGAAALAADGTPEDVLWALWDASGLAGRWEQASRSGGPGGAAADRELDAAIALFAAAARFTDRLPHAGPAAFADHLLAQQIPGDPVAAVRAEPEAVAVLTAHASKGLEWDLVCVAGVQEGRWPDLRRRGSMLDQDHLVDLLAGRDRPGAGGSAQTQLAEERRLFYVAVTRARRRLLVTAVCGEEEQPSRFLDELDPCDGARPLTVPRRGAHLPALVAELRAAACDEQSSDAVRAAAAAHLATLATAGVPGADPDDWWGLTEISTENPVADPTRPVPVSPSRVEAFVRCELRAVLTDLGARDGDALAASLGLLVHEIAATAPAGTDLAGFERLLDDRWATLQFGAPWFAANERARARAILARLVEWLRSSRAELTLLATEEPFDVTIGDAALRGRVDRLERRRDGSVVVVDLKTTKSKKRHDEMAEHPQLAAYQLAVEHGAFPAGSDAGGALLVQLAATGDPQQRQPPLREAEDPAWIADRVAAVAARLRGAQFTARAGMDCRHCDVRSSCPLQPEGRQVIG